MHHAFRIRQFKTNREIGKKFPKFKTIGNIKVTAQVRVVLIQIASKS